MRAAVLRSVGGEIAVEDVREPEGAVVTVRAAGVNFADVLIRAGRYPEMPDFPVVPGSEIAGDIDGRRVMAFCSGYTGGFAERAAIDPSFLVDLPDDASYAEGAAFLLAFLTAWIPLTKQVPCVAGRTVLVHAAAGGVGSAAVQIALHLGARVVATASTPEKREFALRLGAHEAYEYGAIRESVQADVVVDPVGGELLPASLAVLRPLGTLLAIGYAGGAWPQLSPQRLVGRNVALAGFYLGRLIRLCPVLVSDACTTLVTLWREGAIHPIVGSELPLDDAATALDMLESRRSVGKVVLVP
jgi:NADPH:quinone reductase